MARNDSLTHITDTATLNPDSLHQDSLLRADSVKIVTDTVITYVPKGYKGINHPSVPASEDWVFGVLMALFMILVLSLARSTAWLSESITNFFHVKERSSIFSKTTLNNSGSRFLLHVFSVGVLSLYAYYYLFDAADGYHFKTYLIYLAITSAFFIFKYLLSRILGYVFLDNLSLKLALESYSNVIFYLSISLYPTLLLQIYGFEWINPYTLTIALILCLIACILIIIKLFQIFFRKFVASFYILLYLCTLEILPLILLYEAFVSI
ncbi:MAG: hypothetical protein H6Q20_1267 [Bacteroidetes bacterium]|nr:hypothetical protein [Bacteroidota bacterium]